MAVVEGALKFIDPLARYHRCSWCVGDNLLDLSPCSGCPKAMYCSEECMTKGKLDFHYKYCKLNPITEFSSLCRELVPGDDKQLETLVVERGYARLSAMFNGNLADCAKFLDSKKGKNWDFYDFDWSEMDKSTIERNLMLISLGKHTYREFLKIPSHKALLGKYDNSMKRAVIEMRPMVMVLSRFISTPNEKSDVGFDGNEYYYKGPESAVAKNHIGQIATPLVCFLQVSCVPNVVCLNVDNKIVLMVLRPIKAGEKLTTMLLNSFVQRPKEFRQFLYKSVFGRPCKCIACNKNWPYDQHAVVRCNTTTSQADAHGTFRSKTEEINKFISESKPTPNQWLLLESISVDVLILAKPASFYP